MSYIRSTLVGYHFALCRDVSSESDDMSGDDWMRLDLGDISAVIVYMTHSYKTRYIYRGFSFGKASSVSQRIFAF